MTSFLEKLFRRKQIQSDGLQTEFNRCLSTLDIILFGFGAMVGSGLYVLTGEIAHSVTGPAIIISFLIAALTHSLSIMCYAEFGTRVSNCGSIYVYTYLTIGEFPAFLVAWDLLLEDFIETAVLARGMVAYVNDVLNNALYSSLPEKIQNTDFNPLPLIVIAVVCILVLTGIRPSVWVNNLLAGSNVSFLLFIIIGGFWLGTWSNWVQPDGFLPFGVGSIFDGAAQAYFIFLGYKSITVISEEAINPSFSIPFALSFCFVSVTLLSCLVGAALTSMSPYTEIVEDAVFSTAFRLNGWEWAEYIVVTGAIVTFSGSLLTRFLVMPRFFYAVAKDGLLFKFLSHVNSTTQIPMISTVVSAFIAAIFAFSLSLPDLVRLLSMAPLQANVFLALNLIIMRYSPVDLLAKSTEDPDILESGFDTHDESKQLTNGNSFLTKNQIALIGLFLLLTLALTALTRVYEYFPDELKIHLLIIISLLTVFIISVLLFFYKSYNQNSFSKINRMPLVPFLPALSILINLQLMTRLNWTTWVRLVVWHSIGFAIYFLYGMKNSKVQKNLEEENNYGATKEDQ